MDLILCTNAFECCARDFDVLRAGAGTDTDRADTNAINDDGKAAFQIGQTATGSDGQLHFKIWIETRRWLAMRCSRDGFGFRCFCRKKFCPIHADISQHVAAIIDDGDVLRHAEFLGLGDGRLQRQQGTLMRQLQERSGCFRYAHGAIHCSTG